MKRLIALGIFLIVGIELLALILHDRRLVLAGSGARPGSGAAQRPPDAGQPGRTHGCAGLRRSGEGLRRWLSNTETTIRWSESTRADWDRHLRPMLARRFEIATGHRQAKDPVAFAATGRMLFGDELWEWVNLNNVTHTGDRQPGPGRAALEEILQKLEQV